jgi:hypothetical protein
MTEISILQSSPYKPLIKIYNFIEPIYFYLAFKMFGETFNIYVECAFNENGRLTDGYLKTYFSERRIEWFPTVPRVIHSVSFDRIGNIDKRYTIDDFAVPYLMNIVASYKKYVADLHLKNNYTILLRSDGT